MTLCYGTMFGQPKKVIVMMADKYDDAGLVTKTQFMSKSQRRDFVIQEKKAFCAASQQEVIDFLDSFRDENAVSEIKQFWSFNGFSCEAEDYVISQLVERKDVMMVYLDEMRQMLSEGEKTHPAGTKDIAWHVDKVTDAGGTRLHHRDDSGEDR